MRTKHIIYTAAMALTVAGCRQDAPQTETIDPGNLRFEVAVAQPAGNGETGTRAVKTGWTEGDAIVVHFDGNEQNTLWLRYNLAGEWETTSASVATINPKGGSAQALHATFLSPGSVAGAIDADGAQVFTDSGTYIVAAGTVYVTLTLDQRITSRITVEGLENPGEWVLAGPGIRVWSGITPGLFGTTGGTWASALREAFVASNIEGDLYAHGHVMPWEATGTTSFIVLGTAATDGTTLQFKNLATGKAYERTYVSADLGSSKAVTIRMQEDAKFPEWTDLTPETITAEPAPLDFGSLYERYIAQDPKEVVIKNTGKSVVTLVQPTATDFEIGPLSKTTIAAGESATLPVSLKTGLAPGDYNETIAITGNGTAAASVQVLFTVKAIPDNGIGYQPPQENNW